MNINQPELLDFESQLKMKSILRIESEITDAQMKQLKDMNADKQDVHYIKYLKTEKMNTYIKFVDVENIILRVMGITMILSQIVY